MTIKAYTLYGLVRLLRPLRWLAAQGVMFVNGIYHFSKQATNVLQTILVMMICMIASSGAGFVYDHVPHTHSNTVLVWGITILALSTMVLWIFMIYLNSRKTQNHIQQSFMEKQNELELRFALDKAIPQTNHTKEQSRL